MCVCVCVQVLDLMSLLVAYVAVAFYVIKTLSINEVMALWRHDPKVGELCSSAKKKYLPYHYCVSSFSSASCFLFRKREFKELDLCNGLLLHVSFSSICYFEKAISRIYYVFIPFLFFFFVVVAVSSSGSALDTLPSTIDDDKDDVVGVSFGLDTT